MRHTATIEDIDAKLLFEQKCDLLDVIGFLESHVEDYPITLSKKRIKSLEGILNMIDVISDQIPNYYNQEIVNAK